MNWDKMSINTKKHLVTIMARTLKPLKYTSGYVIDVNLDSFNSVSNITNLIFLFMIFVPSSSLFHVKLQLIKLSYSVYNLLQQSSNR